MATEAELLQRVYSVLGAEHESGIVRPMILAQATLAYADLARFLLDTNSPLAKKLAVTLTGQNWSSSSFAAPSNMLFHKQLNTTSILIDNVIAHQVSDRKLLSLIAQSPDIKLVYYALEGKTFIIKHYAGTTSGTGNLIINYYKIPAVADIDAELMPLLLEFLLKRLVVSNVDKIDHDMSGKQNG